MFLVVEWNLSRFDIWVFGADINVDIVNFYFILKVFFVKMHDILIKLSSAPSAHPFFHDHHKTFWTNRRESNKSLQPFLVIR